MKKIGMSDVAAPSDAADAHAYSAPAAAGASSAIADWIEPLMPLTRMRLRVGVICGISADTAGIWMPAPAERTALNLLGRLSGIATLTRAHVDAVAGTGARIADTRKTTPGLRALEKHAVAMGGGLNHRFGLDDAILIKDNHIAVCSGVGEAIRRARAHAGHLMKIEVEVDGLHQLDEALAERPDVVMLDNFSLDDLRAAVARAKGQVVLEASGGVNLQTVRAIAETGVDVISVGALTHSAPSLDVGLDAG